MDGRRGHDLNLNQAPNHPTSLRKLHFNKMLEYIKREIKQVEGVLLGGAGKMI